MIDYDTSWVPDDFVLVVYKHILDRPGCIKKYFSAALVKKPTWAARYHLYAGSSNKDGSYTDYECAENFIGTIHGSVRKALILETPYRGGFLWLSNKIKQELCTEASEVTDEIIVDAFERVRQAWIEREEREMFKRERQKIEKALVGSYPPKTVKTK